MSAGARNSDFGGHYASGYRYCIYRAYVFAKNKIDVYNGFPENVARGFVSDFMRAALGIVDGSCDREIEYSAEGNAIRLKSSDMVLSLSNFARVGDVSAPMEISAEQSLLGIKLRVLDFEK